MHENPKTAHKNAQKRSENVKPCIHNFVSTGMDFAKVWLSMCANGSVRFARYCGKMYSGYLFPYGRFRQRVAPEREACGTSDKASSPVPSRHLPTNKRTRPTALKQHKTRWILNCFDFILLHSNLLFHLHLVNQ